MPALFHVNDAVVVQANSTGSVNGTGIVDVAAPYSAADEVGVKVRLLIYSQALSWESYLLTDYRCVRIVVHSLPPSLISILGGMISYELRRFRKIHTLPFRIHFGGIRIRQRITFSFVPMPLRTSHACSSRILFKVSSSLFPPPAILMLP